MVGAMTRAMLHARLPLIGRADELAVLLGLLHDHEQVLLTLTGPGGSGKTRLAMAVAQAERDAYAGGVWLVELASMPSPMRWPISACC
jgi:predicted ATPase